jgi:hypothetical protein
MLSISEEFRNLILAQKIQRLCVSNNAEAVVLLPLKLKESSENSEKYEIFLA